MRHFNRLILAAGIFPLILALLAAAWLLHRSAPRGSEALLLSDASPRVFYRHDQPEILLKGQGFDERTRAALVLDSGNRHAIIGRLSTPATVENIEVREKLAYLANNFLGFQVVDLQSPAEPRIIGSDKDSFRAAWDLEIVGNHALVADVKNGVIILDIADPRQPRKVGHFATGRRTIGIAMLSDTIAILAQGTDGLLVLDVSDLADPQKIAHVETSGFAWNVFVDEPLAYVCDGDGGLKIFDLSDPQNVRSVGHFDTNGHLRTLTIEGSRVFLADGGGGVKILDVQNPRHPRLLGQLEGIGHIYDVQVRGRSIYAAAAANGLLEIDISDPAAPRLSGLVDTPGFVRNLALDEEHAYMAAGDRGLQVVRLDRIQLPQVALDFPEVNSVPALFNQDGHLIVAHQGEGLQRFATDELQRPKLLIRQGPSFKGEDVAVHGNLFFFAAGRNGLQVFTRSEKNFLRHLASLSLPGVVSRVDLVDGGNYALIAAGPDGLLVIDVRDPSKPIAARSFADLGDVVDLEVNDELVTVIDRDGTLYLLDFHRPSAPEILNSLSMHSGLEAVTIINNSLCAIASLDDGVSLVDIGDPLNPIILTNTLPGAEIRALWSRGDMLVLLVKTSKVLRELVFFDVKTPENPTALRRFKMKFAVAAGAFGPKAFYVVDGLGKLSIFNLANPKLPELHEAVLTAMHWNAMAFAEGKLWGSGVMGGLEMLDLENPLLPEKRVVGMENFWEILDIKQHSDNLWVLDRKSGVHCFSSRLERRLDSLGLPGQSRAWSISGDYCYVLNAVGDIQIIDISDPENLRPVAVLGGNDEWTDLVVHGRIALVAAGNAGLEVWDFSDFSLPVRIAEVPMPWPRKKFAIAHDLAWEGRLAVVANGNDGVLVLDMSEPARPAVMGHFQGESYCRKVWLDESMALVQAPKHGLLVIDLTNPVLPTLACSIETQADVTDLVVDNDFLWLALGGKGGVDVIPKPVFSIGSLLESAESMKVTFPAPPAAGLYNLHVFSLRGSVDLRGGIHFIEKGAIGQN